MKIRAKATFPTPVASATGSAYDKLEALCKGVVVDCFKTQGVKLADLLINTKRKLSVTTDVFVGGGKSTILVTMRLED